MPAAAPLASPGSRATRGLIRPWARPGVAKLRLGRRIAAGLTPAQAAGAENLPAAEVAALVADPGFAALVDECRALGALPEEEARRKLVSLARFLLVEALGVGDMRAVVFVLREEGRGRGRDPARSLADGVLAAHRRAAATPPVPPAPTAEPTPAAAAPRSARPAPDPADRMVSHAAAGLRAELRREMAIMHRATATVGDAPDTLVATVAIPARPVPTPASPAASSERKPRNRHERRHLAALRRREGGGVASPGQPRPRPAPRARAP